MRLNGSNPEVGSSNIKISGRPIIAIAIDSFLLFPPDNYFDFLFLSLSIPKVFIISYI